MTDPIQQSTEATQLLDLSPEDLDQVAGGAAHHSGGVLVALGDGSVRNVAASDYAIWRSRYGTGI